MGHSWQIQEAKNKFSELVESAKNEGAQLVTKHGIKTAVILSFDDYQKLMAHQESVIEFFRKSPLGSAGLDLKRKKEFPRKTGF